MRRPVEIFLLLVRNALYHPPTDAATVEPGAFHFFDPADSLSRLSYGISDRMPPPAGAL